MTTFRILRARARLVLLAPLALALLVAAGAEAQTRTLRVAEGGSIAAALEEATPGTVIEVEPGVYPEALRVETPNLTLRGLVRGEERPVLEGGGERNDGVIALASPFTMTGFRVQHYKGNGVTTQGVDGVFLSDLVIDDTGLYGVYPVQSRNITVTHTTVTRIKDAAIYVGESNEALVAYNEVHSNVAGIEIENTNDAVVRDNLVYDNTAGILVFVLPGKVQKEGLRTDVFRNWVTNNNTPNFGDPEAIVGQLPPGIGLMVMGADDTTLEDNWIKGNDSAGIVVIRLPEEESQKDPELEPLPDRTTIGFHYFLENGGDPDPKVSEGYGGSGDLLWDGTGRGNCADVPDPTTLGGAPLPSCMGIGRAPRSAGDERLEPGAPEPEPAALPANVPEGATVVRIRGMRYEPRHVRIQQGDTVVWVNEDGVAHTVTSGTGKNPTWEVLDSGFLLRGDTYRHTFDEEGTYEYLCLPHMDQAPMRGATVTVGD